MNATMGGLYQGSHWNTIMLSWALTFLVLALVAGLLGFGGVAAGAAGIAKILFFLFIVLFIISLVTGGIRRKNIM